MFFFSIIPKSHRRHIGAGKAWCFKREIREYMYNVWNTIDMVQKMPKRKAPNQIAL
jgi:hypothetical protein